MGPFLGVSTRLPFEPELDKETFRPGDFSADVIAGVSSRGQAIKMDSGQLGFHKQ